ncbi:MAG: SRPBCC domain-containing protein [Pseudomonadota bacterium]|nr:SRPBCC domain-containing protein [Pseudomonadota bacterium]
MALKTRGFALRMDVDAPVEKTWNALCGPAVSRWLGEDARLRPQRGGSWSATIAPGITRHAMIDVFDPPRRLRLIYLPPDELSVFDGAVADDILLEGEEDRTIVRLLCSGVPDLPEWNGYYARVRQANERALSRLKALLEGRR